MKKKNTMNYLEVCKIGKNKLEKMEAIKMNK